MQTALVEVQDLEPAIDLYSAFSDFVKYLDTSPRTVQTYTGNIRQFFKWLEQHQIRHPAREDVLAFRDELRSRCKPATTQAYIVALRLFFRWTAQRGIYPDIAEHVKGARIDSYHKRDALTVEQIQTVLASIDTRSAMGKRDYAILTLMAAGGLRDIEVSRARVSDLEQLGGKSVLLIQGKGHDERTDLVLLPPEVETPIRAYLQTRTNAKGSSPLFTSLSNQNRGGQLSPRSISAIVKGRLVDAGYNSTRLTAHSLRHTAVTTALAGGVPIEEVQAFARHKSISTTLVYAHHLDRENNRSTSTIAAAIFHSQGGNLWK